jgi:hypothetical protein
MRIVFGVVFDFYHESLTYFNISDIAVEIDEIRAGLWDAKIRAELQILSVPTGTVSTLSQTAMAETSDVPAEAEVVQEVLDDDSYQLPKMNENEVQHLSQQEIYPLTLHRVHPFYLRVNRTYTSRLAVGMKRRGLTVSSRSQRLWNRVAYRPSHLIK